MIHIAANPYKISPKLSSNPPNPLLKMAENDGKNCELYPNSTFSEFELYHLIIIQMTNRTRAIMGFLPTFIAIKLGITIYLWSFWYKNSILGINYSLISITFAVL
jgi:hypothetical protein